MIGQGKTRGQVAILNTESATNQNAAAIVVNEDHDATYVFQQLLFRYKQIRNLSNSSGQQNLNLDIIKSIKLPKVTLVSQVYSANTLAVWDKAIEKTEALIAAKEKKFAWLTSNLINRANHDRHTASKYMSEVSTRNKGNKIVRVLSVTNHSGFVLPEERFKRRVASANVSNYKVIEKGQYAYNPSRINVGSIARLDNWNSGILSPMYVVFNIDRSQVRSDYFLHWLKSCETRQRIKNSAQGSVRETVSFKDLGAIDIPLPSMDLQKEIAYSLNAAQNEITLLKKILNKYHHQKRGLMQKLLTGEWQVNVNTKQPEETLKEVSA
ncbi:MAG: restriction endonuclease subunit S [Gammaproteobacteria bacterium]|nr:restriction endonuclease subunit S [Gammaproteobacteria bacterium]